MAVHRPRRPRVPPPLRAVALVLLPFILLACTSVDRLEQGQGPQPTVEATTSATPTAGPPSPSGPSSPSDTAGPTAPRDERVPDTRRPAVLAAQLERAAATIADHDAAASDVRRSAELHQLAVRHLARTGASYRRRVVERLAPDVARTVRSDVGAARLLRAMTEPQRRLPRWRIVEPPPAEELLAHYRRAQRRTGVPWNYLAAIHLVETRMGRIRGTSTAGARGPMQFLPATWELYGAGGDIDDPGDAILAAARLLRAHGAPGDMDGALWHYNPSDNYVRAVTEHARTMQRSASAYRGYWHWRVLYRHARGTYVLPEGYPDRRPLLLADRRSRG